MKMKVAPSKGESKKRKRDDSKEPISESPKKAKVHAQRKFAQGAAFNNSVMTPIKDKVRPATATPSSGPMLTSKCPNTEDFLTFLCFRRTSILPPKLDFFKDVLGSDQKAASIINHKSHSEKAGGSGITTKKHTAKKNDAIDENKKCQPAAVQALRRKYQEQRLAKQKVTNVAKLAQKVKGKNMVRTRSSGAAEELKPVTKKRISGKENKTASSGLRSGLKRIQPVITKSSKKIIKPKHLRTGLRSSGLNVKATEKSLSNIKVAVINMKKSDRETKRNQIEVPQIKTKNLKLKKTEGFSDFSSDDNEPLLAVKKPKITAKKSAKIPLSVRKEEKKTFVKTRSQANESDLTRTSARPTRKTKEAAAIYMEMITKKLVSPDKSGDDDVSSVDSFPELPNAKQNEQRESEIKTKALAFKKAESKQAVEEKTKESKKSTIKKTETSKFDANHTKDDSKNFKKAVQLVQKEVKHSTKSEENSTLAKRSNRGSVKEKQNAAESEKKENNVPVLRPSTRSRYQDDTETVIIPKKIPTRVSLTKHSKATQNSENQSVEKVIQTIKKAKVKPSKTPQKERMANYEKNSKALGDGVESAEKQEKETKKDLEKEAHKINEEGKDKVKEGDFKKGKKSLTNAKSEEKETEIRNSTPSSKKIEKREIKQENSSCSDGKRPTRKCSAADKICFEIDNFTSDEDDFINTFKASKTRASTKKIGFNKDKEKSKKDIDKKFPKALSNVANKNEKAILLHEEVLKEESKKKENKKGKMDSKLKPVVNEKISSKPAIENESQKKLIVEKNVKRSEENKVHQECTAESNECRMLNLKRAKVTSENKKEEKVDTNQSESTNMKISNENSKLVANKQDTESSQNKEILRENLSVSVNIKNVSEVEAKTVQNEVKQGKEALEKDLGGTKDESKKNDTKLVKAVADITEASRTLRDRTLSEELSETSGKCNRRIRPVRQCSTGEKKWIEIDSDSFSLYETSDEEDNLPILDFSSKNKDKSSPIGTDTKECNATEEEKKEKKVQSDIKKKKREDLCSDNFSDSDEEPLKKKALISNNVSPEKSQGNKALPEGSPGRAQRAQREVPDLHPLKKIHSETQPLATTASTSTNQPPEIIEPRISNVPPLNEPKPLLYETKNIDSKSEVSAIRPSSAKELQDLRTHLFMEQGSSPVVSVPNRIEMILHSLKKDKLSEVSSSYSNDVKVTFGNVPYHPISHTSQFIQTPCNYQVKPIISFPQPREPISTHGLDLLSEVALPTTPKEKLNSQTERIEKWLKDSLAVEQKKNFPAYEDLDYKGTERSRIKKCGSEKQDLGLYFGKPPVNVSSQPELQKFGQFELSASQKLLKKNIFAAEVKSDAQKVEQPTTPFKKGLTSVQDLLKLQKERKDVLKSPVENSSHLKNCKCNNCIVKKGWFKNKPVPKPEPQKSCSVEDCEKSAKPFQSLTKALTKVSADGKNPKMSVSVAPIVVTSSSTVSKSVSTPSKEGNEKKGIFQQRKLSFLERMKERERKESASVKPSPNAFSPNNESSVYAFEPEPEQVAKVNAPFRSKTRESRTSSTSKSDDDCLKICEDDSSTALSSGNQVEKSISENKGISKSSQSASIAVQVNLDSETITEVEAISEIQDGKSIEISTQTEVPEEDSESPMFYIPLQQATTTGTAGSSEQQLIQGVAVELGTEGPMGPNQRVVMKAKLVTKPPDAPSIKAVVMPQPKRIFDKKNNNPPIGTVQPTTRKPPEEPKTTDTGVEPLSLMKDPPLSMEIVTQASSNSDVATAEGSTTKSCKNSTATVSVSSTKTREKNKDQNVCKEKGEISEECSPCSSASSSKSKRTSKQKSSETVINPTNTTWLPPAGSASKLVEAPTFHATEKDFQDPFEFFDRIRPAAEKFGLCRIVPPSSFKPDCKVSDDMRFTADNQYVHRMFHRWGPNIKEMMAIKKYLATQSISLKQPPWIGGIEVDLPRLYQSVQNCGGLMKVMEKKKWHQVADMMKIPKAAQDRVTKLDDIYCKYLLPYDTLSHDERQKLFDEVEKDWLERQQSSSESPDSQGDEEGEEENYIEECEECVVKGRNMALNQFYRIARNTMTMWFKNPEPLPREVENEFWKHVSERNHHVCVHSGSIDSSGWGYGFPIAKNNSFSKHPWNLKVLTNNSRSVLRSLGPAMGVTVPTLHVGMVFTAFCWYRDPHGLPWIEYLHTGAPKIWYGISDDNSSVFQDALSKLLPRHIKNKTIWLPSDTAMIPPALLVEHGVSLCHTIQEPGQFILVFPRAFISSICTGYLVSESVYFAQSSWLTTAEQAFKDIQESCEPSMFSLEKLLFSIATDSRSSVDVLKQVLPMVWHVRQKEIDGRKTLFNLGLKASERLPAREVGNKKRKGRWTQDDEGDYECEICRMNLFVSLVTNSHEEGTYCLPHAIELLTQKRHQLKYCKLMYTYTQEEMNELVEKLEQKIESKSQKKPQGKSSSATK